MVGPMKSDLGLLSLSAESTLHKPPPLASAKQCQHPTLIPDPPPRTFVGRLPNLQHKKIPTPTTSWVPCTQAQLVLLCSPTEKDCLIQCKNRELAKLTPRPERRVWSRRGWQLQGWQPRDWWPRSWQPRDHQCQNQSLSVLPGLP